MQKIFDLLKDYLLEFGKYWKDSDKEKMSRFKVRMNRRVVRKFWKASKYDMQSKKETLGFLKAKIYQEGDDLILDVLDVDRIKSGLSEEELVERFGWLSLFIGGAVEIPKSILANSFYPRGEYIGTIHTHPLAYSPPTRFKKISKISQDPCFSFKLPPTHSHADISVNDRIAKELARILKRESCLVLSSVTTCYPEAIVVQDTFFHRIIPRISKREIDLIELKRNLFEEFCILELKETGKEIDVKAELTEYQKMFWARSFMISSLRRVYEYVTLRDYESLMKLFNKFCWILKRLNYVYYDRIPGGLQYELLRWRDSEEILWKIAEQEFINRKYPAVIWVSYYDEKINEGMPDVVKKKIVSTPFYNRPPFSDSPYFKIHSIHFYGNKVLYPEVEEFKRNYKKFFGKELKTLTDLVEESDSLLETTEIQKIFPEYSLEKIAHYIIREYYKEKLLEKSTRKT